MTPLTVGLIVGVVVLVIASLVVGIGVWLKYHKTSGGPFYPVRPIHQKIPILKLLPLDLIPINGGGTGKCLSLTNNPQCPLADPSIVNSVTIPISQPVKWLLNYVLNFPKYIDTVTQSMGAMVYFVPWKPVDVVGNNLDQDAMWLMMLVDGGNSSGDLYRYPTLFDGLNPSITNNAQAVQEYGPGWTADTGGCSYTVTPWNKQISPTAFTTDMVLGALKAILGPSNPA